jgi:hypothetical protein
MGGSVHLKSFPRIDGKEKQSSPQEEPHLQVPRIFLEETIRSLHETLHGCPADLVSHLDEVGISNWEDRKPKRIVLPITVSAQGSQHSPSNISERETHVDRDVDHRRWRRLTPSLITFQDSAALHPALEATGVQTGKHLILKHRAKPDVNADLFENDIRTVFLPHLAITRIM